MMQTLSSQCCPTATEQPTDQGIILRTEAACVCYCNTVAIRDVWLDIPRHQVTAFIGPSGCGKSTLLRCFNRLNDSIDGFNLTGRVTYDGHNLYAQNIDPVKVRRMVGMVFQKPNPFPKSIYDNIAYGARVTGYTGDLDELVERSLRRVGLWDEVKDNLKRSGFSLSGGQQQRLCIARTIATEPEVILMDEPCSALDPISTQRIESLISELAQRYTIIIVTHNLQQAARIADRTAVFNTAPVGSSQTGYLVEYDETPVIFNQPKQSTTYDYVMGRFG